MTTTRISRKASQFSSTVYSLVRIDFTGGQYFEAANVVDGKVVVLKTFAAEAEAVAWFDMHVAHAEQCDEFYSRQAGYQWEYNFPR